MDSLRRDIVEAQSRMRVTFGTRTAIRHLQESLQTGETVHEMIACWYSSSEGLLVLTDRRALAVRDDYSTFRLQDVALRDATAIDYAPTVHDGLAVLTGDGRVAVRKMDRQDSDRFVTALLARRPGLVVLASRPGDAAGHPRREPDGEPTGHAPAGPSAEADRDVILGVLADLHAKGILTAEELAAKTAQVTTVSEN